VSRLLVKEGLPFLRKRALHPTGQRLAECIEIWLVRRIHGWMFRSQRAPGAWCAWTNGGGEL